MKLSILMAAYNEEKWIEQAVMRVLNQNVPGISEKELVIVNDGSSDDTKQIIQKLADKYPEKIITVSHERNLGKGAAIKSAIDKMTGDICIIQDADIEYETGDYPLVLEPIINGRADCIYGSRFIGTQPKRVLFFWHYVGNRLVTLLSNICTNLNLTDMETGCKAFKGDILRGINIRSKDFGFEPEITAKIAHRKYRIYEVGINYNGRTYSEGKKITWLDGIKAIFTIIRFWLIRN